MRPELWRVAVTGSTNEDLKALARAGAPAGTAILADRQTAGKGRLGRDFYSPAGGLYLSLLLRPELPAEQAVALTAAAAVAARRAILEITGLETGIKWVNDLYREGKKVCGILTEGCPNAAGGLDWAVAGVGINLDAVFPPALEGKAGSLFSAAPEGLRDRLAEALLEQLPDLCSRPLDREILEEYRSASLLTGRKILHNGRQGTVLDICNDYSLLATFESGETVPLRSGEAILIPEGFYDRVPE